jgi:single-strand DNA-binding protein
MNVVLLTGRMGQDPDLKFTGQGNSVANATLVQERHVKNDAGTGGRWGTRPVFHKLVAWNRTAENLRQSSKKGDLVAVRGQLTYSSWVDDNGICRTTAQITVQQFEVLSRPKPQVSDSPPAAKPKPKVVRRRRPEPADEPLSSQNPDDIPF